MKPIVIKNTGKEAVIRFDEVSKSDLTVINLAVDALNNNDNTKIVRFIETHPELEARQLVIEVHEGSAIETFAETLGSLIEDVSAIANPDSPPPSSKLNNPKAGSSSRSLKDDDSYRMGGPSKKDDDSYRMGGPSAKGDDDYRMGGPSASNEDDSYRMGGPSKKDEHGESE